MTDEEIRDTLARYKRKHQMSNIELAELIGMADQYRTLNRFLTDQRGSRFRREFIERLRALMAFLAQ